MDYSLSDVDVRNILRSQRVRSKILTYTELAAFKTLKELFGDYQNIVICYLTRKNYGHWCCLFCSPKENELNFFDPYGLEPDQELDWNIDNYFRREAKEDYSHLTYLLYTSGIPVSYNQYQFQKRGKGIATCGRHTVVRLALRELSCEQYKDVIEKCCANLSMSEGKEINPDQLVLKWTAPLLQN